MYAGKIVFAQFFDHFPMHSFRRSVSHYRGGYKQKRFSCLDQYLCMAFAQLTYRESLRDIEACLRAQESKLYHMGIHGRVSRSTLADPKAGNALVFLTNNFTLPALTIAKLYRLRWQVELFFKWIKQHLRINRFFGTSENADKTQIWIAVSVYLLVAIVKKRLQLEASLYTILQILSITAFEKISLLQVLRDAERKEGKEKSYPYYNQLKAYPFASGDAKCSDMAGLAG